MQQPEKSDATDTALEITCRNCKEKFAVPELARHSEDVPCPTCSFINHLTPPGTFSRAGILAKIGKIVGDEPEVDEHSAFRAHVKGGIALVVAILLAIIYTLLNN